MAVNPIVSITNYTFNTNPFHSVRRSFSLIDFKSMSFFFYGIAENQNNVVPAIDNSVYFWSVADAYNWSTGPSPVKFITDSAWALGGTTDTPGLTNSPSGFITPANTLMPKLVIPSFGLVDNGIEAGTDNGSFGERRGVFNWSVLAVTQDDTGTLMPYDTTGANSYLNLKYLESNGDVGSKWVYMGWKDDSQKISKIKLSCAVNAERVAALQQFASDPTTLVGNGAGLILLNITPNNAGKKQTGGADGGENWSVEIEYPNSTDSVKINFNDTGSTIISIKNPAGNIEQTKMTLTQAKGKEQPPQYQKMISSGTKGSSPYCIVVYPIWNGVAVSDGIQDGSDAQTNSSFAMKDKDAHVLDQAYTTPFLPENNLGNSEALWGTDGAGTPLHGGSQDFAVGGQSPADLNFKAATPSNVIPNFGTGLNLTLNGCKASIAYLPLFFLKYVNFDYYFTSNVDLDSSGNPDPFPGASPNAGYPKLDAFYQWAFPIWTDNTSNFKMKHYNMDGNYQSPPAATVDAEYRRMNFSGFNDNSATAPQDFYGSYGGEFFGFWFEADENQLINIVNGDGAYPLGSFWSGGVAGDPNPLGSWIDYIENLNVSVGLDGASGSISIDKYGVAGQTAEPDQNIGSLILSALGSYSLDFTQAWDGSHPASSFNKDSGTDNMIFTGFGMGAGQTDSSDGSTFTIPLLGREKKIEDIMLINAPFFDGYKLRDVITFLCQYGGLEFTDAQFHGDPTILDQPILSSENINVPVIDYRPGTSVMAAFQDLAEKQALRFYIKRDGLIHFYALGADGLPTDLGYDWGNFYGPNSYTFRFNSRDNTPDFEDIRNEIVAIAQTQTTSSGSNVNDISLSPITRNVNNRPTSPDFPWSKMLVQGVPGFLDVPTLDQVASYYAARSKRYILTGNISVVGNPYIEPFDTWTIGSKQYVVDAVSHSMDFGSKTWTTSVQLFGSGS